jgi:hypothetical protein
MALERSAYGVICEKERLPDQATGHEFEDALMRGSGRCARPGPLGRGTACR